MEPVNDPRLYSHRYQVTHLIARGGMAMVYRAQDTLLNRAVALKILYPELSQDPLFVERFRREAQAAANLSHPNIVPVFDWGEDSGTYFIVMELVEGTSLAELLRGSKTLSPARSAQIVAQVAAALGYAHRNDVVHRDVKPGNILLTRDGQVKVTDFGIAQAVSSEDQLAEAGLVMGTATYFSPEQAEGASVDGRSDVYSLGVVLYEMLAGRPPFVGDTPVEVSSQHVHSTVPALSEVAYEVPHDLEAIVMEALAKSPAQRYQSADELRADLLRFSEGQPVQAAQRDVAFFGADATRAVSAVAGRDKTEAVPIMVGPRTDVRRRRRGYLGPVLVLIIALLAGGAFAYAELTKAGASYMPDEIGQSLRSATQQLRSDGFLVSPVFVNSNQPKNMVLSSVPKAGKRIARGQSVTLMVSLGKTTTTVTVLSVTGMTLANAENSLTNENLTPIVNYVTTPPPGNPLPGVVLSQSPSAGAKVQTGSKVMLNVLAAATKYPMPSVAGDTQVQAASTLTAAGLSVSPNSTQVCSNTVKSGYVVTSTPPAGTLVTSGEAVSLVVSTGNCPAVVPNVLNDTQSAATSQLEQQGFVPKYTTDPTAVCAPGQPATVATENPQGGSTVTYGSKVNLTLCQLTPGSTTTGSTTPGNG